MEIWCAYANGQIGSDHTPNNAPGKIIGPYTKEGKHKKEMVNT